MFKLDSCSFSLLFGNLFVFFEFKGADTIGEFTTYIITLFKLVINWFLHQLFYDRAGPH